MCFGPLQDSCQERNGRSSRVCTRPITNTGSPAFGSPTWRPWPAARAGSKTITRSNYCWRCSIIRTHTITQAHWWRWGLVFWQRLSLRRVYSDTHNDRGVRLNAVKWPQQASPFVCEQELNGFRGKCSMLFHYDMISVPLVYTQVRLHDFLHSHL